MTKHPRVLHAIAGISTVVLVSLTVTPFNARAQGDQSHDARNDHHNAPLHFSHPLFTESPSPDTKIRLDYLYANLARRVHDNTFQVEGEYAFSRNFSIEAALPIISRSVNGQSTTATGSGEIAAKFASFAAAKKGFLIGGGIAFGLPTGDDEKGIGSGHIVEVEPFATLGFMRKALELVSIASFGTAVNRDEGEEEEQEVALAVSLLYHLDPRLESLVEMQAIRAVAGEESGHQVVNAGIGFKYHVSRVRSLVLGVGGRVPLTSHREFRQEFIVSALYHF